MGTLALILLVAFALLSATRGKEPATRESAPAKATKPQAILDNFRFSPETFMIPAGATVTWTNHDNTPHVVMSADNQVQQSPVLKTGQSFFDTRNEAAQPDIVTHLTPARGDAGTRPPFLVASLPSKIFGIKSHGIGKDKCRAIRQTPN